jgi:hypothetical protein
LESQTQATETTRAPSLSAGNDSTNTPGYEALIIQLQQTLLEERENRYISDAEYKARLAQLEAELKALQALQSGSGSTSRPEVETEKETETETTVSAPPDDVPTGTVPDAGLEDTISFSYSIENDCVTIHEYLGGAKAVVLPSTVNGYPVTTIADNAFKNSDVTSVVIPATVTDIGWFAFYGCVSLRSVTVPASVTVIHYAAFDGCPNLTVLCSKDTYAAAYVQSFGLRCEFI